MSDDSEHKKIYRSATPEFDTTPVRLCPGCGRQKPLREFVSSGMCKNCASIEYTARFTREESEQL